MSSITADKKKTLGGCKLKKLTQITKPSELEQLLKRTKTKGETYQLLSELDSNPSLCERLTKMLCEAKQAQVLRLLSPILCELSSQSRAKLINAAGAHDRGWGRFFFASLTAKAIRCFATVLQGEKKAFGEQQLLLIGMLLAGGSSEWSCIIREALGDPLVAEVENAPVIENDAEKFSSLQAFVFILGEMVSANVVPVPCCKAFRESYQFGHYTATLTSDFQNVLLSVNDRTAEMLVLPWRCKNEQAVDLAESAVSFILDKFGLRLEDQDYFAEISLHHGEIRERVTRMWQEIKSGYNRWVPTGGWVKLAPSGTIARAGVMNIELHPQRPIPTMTLILDINRFGLHQRQELVLDEDGLVVLPDGLDEARQYFYLGLNDKVVTWLHSFATVRKYRPSRHVPIKTDPGDPQEVENGKMPPGWHFPEYLGLPKGHNPRKYARDRAEAIGWVPPEQGSGKTFRMSGDPTQPNLGLPEPIEIIYEL